MLLTASTTKYETLTTASFSAPIDATCQLLRTSWCLHAIYVLTYGLSIMLFSSLSWFHASIIVIGFIATLLSRYLIDRGQSIIPSWLIVAVGFVLSWGWTLLTWDVINSGPITIVLPIIFAAILLGKWECIGIACFSALLPLSTSHISWKAIHPIDVVHDRGIAMAGVAVTFVSSAIILSMYARIQKQALTRNRSQEKALRQSERHYSDLVRQSPDGIVALSARGEIEAFNPAAQKITGFRESEVLGRQWSQLGLVVRDTQEKNLVNDRGNDKSGKFDSITKSQQTTLTEWMIKRKNGEICPVEATLQVIHDEGGSSRLQMTFRDISERKRSESERRRLEDQLRQSQKMESVGMLAGGIAHDFNNLLTIIISHSELLAIDIPDENELHNDIQEITRAAQRASSLTRQLLAFSRRQVLELRVLDVRDVIDRVTVMLRRLIGEDIELRVLDGPPATRIRADPGQLEQVLVNLAVNARDAMPDGGRLTISTTTLFVGNHSANKLSALDPGHYVRICVADTGVGISTSAIEHIFEPFFTTKSQGRGSGLGLAMVHGIIKQSGGHIFVESEQQCGARFDIYLPALQAPDSAISLDNPRIQVLPGHETILVVEDELGVREAARKILQRNGYRVIIADTPTEAITLIRNLKEPIDLLLTDVVMPQMRGRELAIRVRTMRPSIKALYMSGYTDKDIVRDGVLESGLDFLAKPFTAATLTSKIREILDRSKPCTNDLASPNKILSTERSKTFVH